MQISFYCRAAKADRNGLAPIQASIIIDGKRTFVNLPRREKPEVFQKQLTSKKSNEIKTFCEIERQRINSIVLQIMESGEPITIDTVRSRMKCGGVETHQLTDLITEYISTLKVEKSTIQKFEVLRRVIGSVINLKREVISVKQKDIVALKMLIEDSYSASSASVMWVKVRSIFQYAFNNGYTKENLTANVRIKRERPKIDFLTIEEINLIKNADIENESLSRIRDCFIFQCASGLSYADLKDLRMSDIRKDGETHYIYKPRAKTNIEYTSVILPFGVSIMAKYNAKLPVISNQKYNSYLKTLASAVGLNRPLYTHLARKSYACFLLNNGVRLEVVSKSLGHASTKITQQHYAQLTTNTIVKEISTVCQ